MEVELLGFIKDYGTTTVLAVLCINLYIKLNDERIELTKTLDQRTTVFLNTIKDLTSSQRDISKSQDAILIRLDKIEEKLK